VSPKTKPATTAQAASGKALARRRPVPRHPGIYHRPRPDGKVAPPYELAYLDSSGKRRWQVVHGSLEDAEAKRAELRLRRRRGERIEPNRQTFDQYATEWLDRQQARPRTLELYSWALRVHLIPYFGRRRLAQIGPEQIAGFVAAKKREGLRGWTVTSALRPLSIMLAQAARRGQIPVNPFTQLERGERPKHDDQRPRRILTLEEMEALLAHTEEPQLRLLYELLLTSGLRIGEALGLTVQDLDFAGALIQVECQLGRDGHRTRLKTPESRRAIDIPPGLMRRLRAQLMQRGALADPEALLFASKSGSGLERKVVRAGLTRAAKAARLPSPAPTLHDLRHSHASMLIAMDISVVDVQHRLGHRKPDTTLRVYAHQWKLRDARKSSIGAQVGELLQPRRAELHARQQRALPPARTA
jgi:integrase